ncbi:MAG: hypothetical protein P4L92_13060 [Rudaea sp.]|nr:hypothetical protein [Rudaea sp.]
MLRIGLFALAALLVGVAHAQVADNDPLAAAPVAYSSAPQGNPGCDSGVYNADGSPVISCSPDIAQPVDEEGANATAYQADTGGIYYDEGDAADPSYFTPDFYLGVSLLPYGYWYPGFGFAWPYYGFGPFGYGFGVAFAPYAYFGGNDAFGRGGYGGHYHGPYRYVGNGRYWDQGRYAAMANPRGAATHANRAGRGLGTASTTAAIRADTGRAGALTSSRFAAAQAAPSRSTMSTNNRPMGTAAQAARRSLPSASYYAAAQRGGLTANPAAASRPTASIAPGNRVGLSGDRAANARSANPYWVTSMPSRGYATSAYRNNAGSPTRAYGSASRSYAAPRASYAMPPQRYSPAGRSYSAGRAMPSYSRSSPAVASHGGGSSSAHFSGSRAGGDSRGH